MGKCAAERVDGAPHVLGRLDLGEHDAGDEVATAQSATSARHSSDAASPMRTHGRRPGLGDRRDERAARLALVVRRDAVLEVDDDDVGDGCRDSRRRGRRPCPARAATSGRPAGTAAAAPAGSTGVDGVDVASGLTGPPPPSRARARRRSRRWPRSRLLALDLGLLVGREVVVDAHGGLVERPLAGEHRAQLLAVELLRPRADEQRGDGVAGEVRERARLGHEPVDADDDADAVDQVGAVGLQAAREGREAGAGDAGRALRGDHHEQQQADLLADRQRRAHGAAMNSDAMVR